MKYTLNQYIIKSIPVNNMTIPVNNLVIKNNHFPLDKSVWNPYISIIKTDVL